MIETPIDPSKLRDKYKARERDTVLVDILKKMEDFGITFAELEEYKKNNTIHLRDQILKLKKKARLQGVLNNGGRGKRKEE